MDNDGFSRNTRSHLKRASSMSCVNCCHLQICPSGLSGSSLLNTWVSRRGRQRVKLPPDFQTSSYRRRNGRDSVELAPLLHTLVSRSTSIASRIVSPIPIGHQLERWKEKKRPMSTASHAVRCSRTVSIKDRGQGGRAFMILNTCSLSYQDDSTESAARSPQRCSAALAPGCLPRLRCHVGHPP